MMMTTTINLPLSLNIKDTFRKLLLRCVKRETYAYHLMSYILYFDVAEG